ncbi:hypothetical protein KIH86_14470 [Paenibacillus sp. HN-1]|uniref:hypothetical protein n=1 Tax=Paenibacillus TaxID=44249 RepID=UPI001CA873F9|nr:MULTISPECIES: hypothetical protein [Paenibacillus]MBY9080622.1 hypothetical protein [Paenibacillus sp. CGMCC 1.18879]MBY9085433.1 hypothetical protein [Paenibacillus sinensis]
MLTIVAVLLAVAAGVRELNLLLRKRLFKDAVVCGILSLAATACAGIAASGKVLPSPLQLIFVLFKPLHLLMISLFPPA